MRVNEYAIRWLVGNMHVGTSYWDVARDIYQRCRRAGMCRGRRKECIRVALEAHRVNRELCELFRL
jgi:hypothetical protein